MNKRRLFEHIHRIVKNVVNEQVGGNLNDYVPKKAFKMVEKVNSELAQLKQMTQTENAELLDTSTGVEIFYEIIGNVSIENGCLTWIEKGGYGNDKISKESWNIVRYDDYEGYWFDEYGFKEQISSIRSGIRKATKYFKEYDTDYDDDENKRSQFLGDL